MALQRAVYRARDAEHTVLHQVIAEHLEVFLRTVAAAGDGAGLPQFVEREFREFLTCGVVEHGVARFRCEGCGREHLVPFSCKGRAWCPSCGGRRMTERAAHLVDAVLPWVPVRQWVLTVPYRLRYQMAWNHGLSRAVLRVYTRVLLEGYARGACARGVPGGRTGSVTVLQRAGSGLNVNLHFHTLVLDGVFSEAPGGALAFHRAPAATDAEVAAALATIRHRVQRLLVRHGLEPGDDATGPVDRLAEESPVLAGIVGASVQGRVALGSRAGARVRRLGHEIDPGAVTSRGPRQAHLEGFDLHANVWVSAHDRAGVERLCRYVLRPPFAQERLRRRGDGRVALELLDGEPLSADSRAHRATRVTSDLMDRTVHGATVMQRGGALLQRRAVDQGEEAGGVIAYNLSPRTAALNNEKPGRNAMKKLMKLLPAVLLAAAILAPHPVAAKPATVIGTIIGGGTAEMEQDPLDGLPGSPGSSVFGLGVKLLSDGSARGHFDCLDQNGDRPNYPGNIFGEVTTWEKEGDVVVLHVIGKLVAIPGGLVARDLAFTVKIQEFGGAGVGHWTLEVDGFIVCFEILTSGQIVYHPA